MNNQRFASALALTMGLVVSVAWPVAAQQDVSGEAAQIEAEGPSCSPAAAECLGQLQQALSETEQLTAPPSGGFNVKAAQNALLQSRLILRGIMAGPGVPEALKPNLIEVQRDLHRASEALNAGNRQEAQSALQKAQSALAETRQPGASAEENPAADAGPPEPGIHLEKARGAVRGETEEAE